MVIALQNARRIFQVIAEPAFDLSPGDLGIATSTLAALGNEVVIPPRPSSSPAYQF
jgi:hypothetical protein